MFAFFPDIAACFGIGCVHKGIIAVEDHLDIDAGVGFYQHILLLHLFVVFTAKIYGRPDRNHGFYAKLLQLLYHGSRIREEFFIETPVTAVGPVIEVDHDDVQGDIPFLVFTGNGKHLLLIIVAQLALPESKTVFGHHGRFSGCVGISFFYFSRSVACSDPVVQLFTGAGSPLCRIRAEMDISHSGIIP